MNTTIYTPTTQTNFGTTNTVAGYVVHRNLPIPARVGRGGQSKWAPLYKSMSVGSAVEMSHKDAEGFSHTVYANGGKVCQRKQANGLLMVWLTKECTCKSWAN